MKFAGLLEAGRIDGVLTESKWVKGTYIAVNTITARDSIPKGVRTAGTKCHVATGNNSCPAGEYIWKGNENDGVWEYVGPGITFNDLEKDNWHIYGRRKLKAGDNAQWVQIDSTYILDMIKDKLITELNSIYAKKEELETEVANLNNLIVNIDGKVGNIETSITELLGEDGKSGVIKGLQDNLGALNERLTTLDGQLHDIKSEVDKVEEFDSRIKSAENSSSEAVQKAEDASSAAKNAQEAIDEVNDEVQKVKNRVADIENGNTIPLATESKVGGIKVAADDSSSEPKGDLIRYYVRVLQEGDNRGKAYVDIKPGEAIIDDEVINNKIWPTIESKINENEWQDWTINGGEAANL